MDKGRQNGPSEPARLYAMSDSSDNAPIDPPGSTPAAPPRAPKRQIGKPPIATPSWHKAQLQRWLYEWSIYRTLASDEDAAQEDLHEKSSVKAGVQLPPGLISPYESTPESLEPGAVRLLDPALVPDANRPVYVLILADWGDSGKLIAPFGPFSVPASTMELLTNREEPHLAVLSLWNQRVLNMETLARSWFIGRFEEVEFDDVLDVWESGMLGEALPPHLHALVGPPIEMEDDPRCEYQSEEVSVFAAVDAEFLASTALEPLLEQNEVPAAALENVERAVKAQAPRVDLGSRIANWMSTSFLSDVVQWLEMQALPAVSAGSAERPSFRMKRYAIAGTELTLSIKTEPEGIFCHIAVLDKNGEPSNKLEGSRFVPRGGQPVPIKSGLAKCSTLALKHGFALLDRNDNITLDLVELA